MTREQILHYMKGGKFTAIYDPKMKDIGQAYKAGNTIEVYQNCLNNPIEDGEYGADWKGQYRFTSPDISGWMPEEDIKDLVIRDEYIDRPESTKKYCYRMTYTKQEQLLPNFGKGYEHAALPMVVYREYDDESDDYVRKLSNPPATTIERKVVDLLEESQPDWEILK